MIRLTLFGTQGCHLCDQAEKLVGDFQINESAIRVDKIDIAEQEQWQERYAVKIPVLYHAPTGKDLCWPFELADIREFVQSIGRQC